LSKDNLEPSLAGRPGVGTALCPRLREAEDYKRDQRVTKARYRPAAYSPEAKTMTRRGHIGGLAWPVVLALAGLCGCSRGGPEFAEVEGVVTYDRKPLPSVEVVFLPDADKGTEGPTAACYTDENGHYRLWCERAKVHGAVVGTHRVCIRDIAAIPPPPETVPDVVNGVPVPWVRPRTIRVPQPYFEANHTPLRDVQVRPGAQTLNFDVKPGTPRR
jgi:hypothetical protein